MINLCQLLVEDTDPIPDLENPRTLLTNSKVCFETLVRLYYLRHGFDAPDMPILQPLVVLSSMSMTELKTLTSSSTTSSMAIDEVRATLFLAAKGMHDQGRNFYLSQAVYQLTQNRMSSEDAELMWKFVDVKREESEAQQLCAKHVQSQFPVNIVKITEDPDTQRLTNMIKQYTDMMLESTSSAEASETESTS